MADRQRLRIFISSPSDVRPERIIAQRVVERLDREFSYHFAIEAVLWEREPLVATESFQAGIVPPRETDIVVVILWSRLGVPLVGEKYIGPLSGKQVTGTEWEFEDAVASHREHRLPDVLLYRKRVEITGSFENETEVRDRLEQKRLVEEFMTRWTRAADGGFAAASWPFDSAAGFEEMLETHLRELIRRRITSPEDRPAGIRWHQGSPFRGLESFEFEHASVFFGRTHARAELRELLVRQEGTGCAFVLVMGASGSGKSSLVKAGLLADLKIPGMVGRVGLCRHAILRPEGDDLVETLAAAILAQSALPELASLHYDTKSLAALLRANPAQASLPIRQGLAIAAKESRLAEHAETRLLVIVDQLEEIFTRDRLDDVQRDAFVAALESLARSGMVWVVVTMRSDFSDRVERLPRLLDLAGGDARYILGPPDITEIGQMIRQPALEAGLRFEVDAARGVGLDDTIQKAAASDRSALPLLSFLLEQLWQLRDERGTLTMSAYQRLGGFEGSLGRRAEEVFSQLPADVQSFLPEVLRTLVSISPDGIEGGRPTTARSASLSQFEPGSPARALVDALLDPKARLLVAQVGRGREPQIRVAHEALISHWPRAREQVEKDARDLQLRTRLEQAAQLWQAEQTRKKESLLLPSGLPLDEARDLVRRWGRNLGPDVLAFVDRSRRAARLRMLRLVAYIVAAMVSIPASVALVWLAMVWYGVRSVERDLALVVVPAGCFDMGSPEGEPGRQRDEGPQRQVCLGQFEIGKVEVTQRQWRAVMLDNPSQYAGEDRPVENVSWDDTQRFLWRLSFFGSRRYRLPSEAEWEYAARAGSRTAYHWGAEFEPEGCKHANINDRTFRNTEPNDPIAPQATDCDDGHYRTAPVGGRLANAFGLHDMHGNVWEWVEDEYHPGYIGAPIDGSAWVGNRPNVIHVIRGGSWHTVVRRVRAAHRDKQPSDYRIGYIGFRIAR